MRDTVDGVRDAQGAGGSGITAMVILLAMALAHCATAPAFATDKPKCEATTDIEQFKGQIHKACGLNIKAVSFNGTPDLATYTVTDDRDYEGKTIAGQPFAFAAEAAAVESHRILQGIYPMATFRYSLRDARGVEVCRWTFQGDYQRPTAGWCLSEVE